MNSQALTRCNWVSQDSLYIDYHDTEWGFPEYDSLKLFENLCLEGQQSGLSWITVLRKRDAYRERFYHFDPEKIVTQCSVDDLVTDIRLIRHAKKLHSIITNAHAYLEMKHNNIDFSDFIWSFVNHKPIVNNIKNSSDIPTSTDISKSMAKSLKKLGFSFVGETTCYAFMQGSGLVNDHSINCFRSHQITNNLVHL